MDNTPFSKKCEILYNLWERTQSDDTWYDMWEVNDLGLNVAKGIAEGLFVIATSEGIHWLELTWQGILEYIDVFEDIGFDSLNALLDYADYSID